MRVGATIIVVVVGVFLAFYMSQEEFHLLPQGDVPGVLNLMHHSLASDKPAADSQAKRYNKDQSVEEGFEGEAPQDMVDAYYNIATDFYEYGWGTSFHFAHTMKDESHEDSIRRHEHRLADGLGLSKGKRVLDAGCGVGGPARAIATYSQANVVALTLNDYQVKRGSSHTKKQGLDHLVEHVQGDFTKIQYPDESFDAAYGIESTCHAPTFESVYGEIFRILKPGGMFGIYGWLTTKNYDSKNEEHVRIARQIEYGNGLPPLRSVEDALKAAKAVGFELVSEIDLAADKENTRPWYHRLKMNWLSRQLTHLVCVVSEFFGTAPKGTVDIHAVLLHAADGLVSGGEQDIFTPMHYILLRKPQA